MSTSNLWWNEYHGPTNLIDKVIETIELNHSVILFSHKIFWQSKMLDVLEENIKKVFLYDLITVDLSELTDVNRNSISVLLSNKLSNTTDVYLVGLHNPIEFFKKKSLLREKVIILKGFKEQDLKKVLDFVVEYRDYDKKNGIFCILSPFKLVPPKVRNISTIDSSTNISEFNIQLFIDNLILNKFDYIYDASYVSSLYFNLSLKNPEYAEYLIQKYDFNKLDPLLIEFEKIDSDVKERLIWESQVGAFFSLIELYRRNFVSRYQKDLEKIITEPGFNSKNQEIVNLVNYEKKPFSSIYELDIGVLYFISKLTFASSKNQKVLNLTDKEQKQLTNLRDFRNNLAHNVPLKLKTLKKYTEFLY